MTGWPVSILGQDGQKLVDRVTNALGGAHISQPSDPLEYAASGSGRLFYAVNGPELDGQAFSKFFNVAHVNQNVQGIKLQPGVYHMVNPCEQSHISFNANKDEGGKEARRSPFFIDFSNVTLIQTSKDHSAVGMIEVANLELIGPFIITSTKEAWTWGQATLTSLSEDQWEWTMTGHDGYPNDRVLLGRQGATNFGIAFDPATRLMRDALCDDFGMSNVEKIGENQYKFRAPYIRENVKVGDLITVRPLESCSAIQMDRCERCTVRGATIHNASCFGVYDGFGVGNVFRDVVMAPYPQPIGNDGQLPLLSVTADGMHFTDCREGPKIVNCYFANLGDDAIAITGHYSPVAAVNREEKSMVVVYGRGDFMAGPGDPIQAYDKDVKDVGRAIVAKTEDAQNPLPPGTRIENLNVDCDGKCFTKVFFEEWPDAWDDLGIGAAVSRPTWNGEEFQVLGNRVHNTRGRGVLSKASRGIIADNTFTHLKGTAIQLAPEYVWQEADFVRDVTVSNNVVDSGAQGIWLGGSTQSGGDDEPTVHRHNRNVLIEQNYMTGCLWTPMIITSAFNVTVRDNTFRNCLPKIDGCDSTKRHRWEVQGKMIFVYHVDGLQIGGNRFFNDALGEFQGNMVDPIELGDCNNYREAPGTCGGIPGYTTGPVETS